MVVNLEIGRKNFELRSVDKNRLFILLRCSSSAPVRSY